MTNTSGNEQPTPPASENIQPLQLQQFNGSGIVDKPVPGVLKLSLLDVIDRGVKHNLGLLLSQQQTETSQFGAMVLVRPLNDFPSEVQRIMGGADFDIK